MTDRQRRIAENESRFREINERLEADLKRIPDDGADANFICECGRADCTEIVPMSLDEYEHVRQDPLLFSLVPGHEFEDAEDVIATTARYAVVRKKPETAPIVEASDPRR